MPDETTSEKGTTTTAEVQAPPKVEVPNADHPGWAPGTYNRFKSTLEENATLKRELETLRGQVGKVPELETKLKATETRYQMDMEMVKAGGNFTHPSVQRVVRREYQEYAQEAGTAAKSFADWFADEETKSNPVIGVHFQTSTTTG